MQVPVMRLASASVIAPTLRDAQGNRIAVGVNFPKVFVQIRFDLGPHWGHYFLIKHALLLADPIFCVA
tara:strand:+ start:316 stop:519 length:204 start_codon:yes stop_codon:yes gene_type:complete